MASDTDCSVQQKPCIETEVWNVDECKCVLRSKYCPKKEVCDLPLVWSWGYC